MSNPNSNSDPNPPAGPALERLLDKEHVVGATFDPATETVNVYVGEKCPCDELDPADIVPPSYGGYPTDIVDCGLGADSNSFDAYSVTHADDYDDPDDHRTRPLASGVSESHGSVGAGTAAVLARVRDTDVGVWGDDVEPGDLVRLSNNHVYLSSGDIGDPIYQPSPNDGGSGERDHVGDLAGYVPLENGVTVDVAARTAGVSDLAEPEYPSGIVSPRRGMSIWKRGRTTQLTAARITETDMTAAIRYGSDTVIHVDKCIATTSFLEPGDSGSPVFTNDGELVGLAFAGSPRISLVCEADEIERQLGVEICTDES